MKSKGMNTPTSFGLGSRKQFMIILIIIAPLILGCVEKEEEEEDLQISPPNSEDVYHYYSTTIEYNNSFSYGMIIEALAPLNYSNAIAGPFIKIPLRISLSDINKTCSGMHNVPLRNGTNFSDNLKISFEVHSKKNNYNVSIEYDYNEYYVNPFLNVTHSKYIIEEVTNHIEDLIFIRFNIHGIIHFHYTYEGPVY